MRISTVFFLFITSASAMFLSGCSDDPVIDVDEFAESAAPGSGSVTNDNSLGDSTPTGRITADGFFILFDPAIPTVFDDKIAYSQQTVDITVFAEDVNDLVELNGQTVNFKAEWGAFTDARDSCDLVNGQCTVTWRSGDPATAPGSCFVAVTAWTEGEEAYFDANDNGLFDVGETYDDLEEPFLDIDSDGLFNPGFISTVEGVGELIDINGFDGIGPGAGGHDAGNGLYDGSQCATGNVDCSGNTSMIIHTRSEILIQQPFDVDDNPATPDSVFCGTNLY